ncbi:hypothetical protein NDA14_006965 [Ustilago hordei]|nr:hypothetical protein NDA14_006965 [Ustilago hordei]
MPPCTCNSDAESSNLSNEPHKERAPTAPHRQMLVDFHQRLSCTHDALKEAPKLTTKNWYAWNPHFWGILSNWPTAMKHLDGTVTPEHKKYDCTLDSKLCTILQSSALLAGNNNINYLFVHPTNSEPWKLQDLYCRLKMDLMKMKKITESTLLNNVGKIHMFQANIHKLITDINEHWAKAELMDHRAGDLKTAQANLADGEVKNKEAYCWDLGATDHVTNDKSNLISSSPCTGFVKAASGTKIHIVAVGQAMLNVASHKVLLDNILYVPDSNANLISVKALTNNGAHVTFDSKYVTFELSANETVIGKLNLQTRHYKISQSQHEALVIGPDEGLTDLPECFDNEAKTSRYPLELVHVDLAMHWLMKTEVTCLLIAIDDASSFTYVKPLWAKLDALQVLKEWITYAEIQMGHKLKTLHSDNGGEWVSAAAIHWQNETGLCWQKTLPYTSKQNGRAEHMIRMIREMMITMMHTHHLPQTFWPFTAEAAAFMKNLWPNIQDTDALHYNPRTNIEDFSYDDIDMHDEDLQQPLNDIYCPAPEQGMALEGETLPLEQANDTLKHPDPPGPANTIHEHLDDEPDRGLRSVSSPIPSNQASDSSEEHAY